jgi:hypothetical protein
MVPSAGSTFISKQTTSGEADAKLGVFVNRPVGSMSLLCWGRMRD